MRPFRRWLKWKVGKLIVETRYHQPHGRVSARRDSSHMRAVNVEANHFLQLGPLVHLVWSEGAHLFLQSLRLGRIYPVLQVQSALKLIAKIWIFFLLCVRQRIQPRVRDAALVQVRKSVGAASGGMRVSKDLLAEKRNVH